MVNFVTRTLTVIWVLGASAKTHNTNQVIVRLINIKRKSMKKITILFILVTEVSEFVNSLFKAHY